MIGLGLHDEPRIRRRLRRRQRPTKLPNNPRCVQDVALVKPVEEMLSERVDVGESLPAEGAAPLAKRPCGDDVRTGLPRKRRPCKQARWRTCPSGMDQPKAGKPDQSSPSIASAITLATVSGGNPSGILGV